MKNLTLRGFAAIILAGSIGFGAAAPAAAGGYGHGGGSVYHSGGGYGGYNPGRHPGYHPGGNRRDRVCQPHEAVEKARSKGLRRAGVERVTQWEIIVTGRAYGNRALLVFDRTSRNCRIIGSRGI